MPGRTSKSYEEMQYQVLDRIFPGSATVPKAWLRTSAPTPPSAGGGMQEITLDHWSGKPLFMCGTSKCGDKTSVAG